LASLGRTWTILRRPDGVPPAKAFNSFTPTHFSPPPSSLFSLVHPLIRIIIIWTPTNKTHAD
jgi:hypothetical protein